MYTYKAKLNRVIDGDTVDAEIDLGFGVFIKQRIRLYGINTPESRTSDPKEKELGLIAKQRLTEILGREFIVETILNKRGKYGRVLGILHIEKENGETVNVNDMLVEEGHASQYNAGGVSKD